MIRKMTAEDKDIYLQLAKEFYLSEAVSHNIPAEFIISTFNEMLKSDRYAECFIIELNDEIAGYAMLVKTWSQEAGGVTVWLEEIYLRENFQGMGLGTEFFDFIHAYAKDNIMRLRLEVAPENIGAIKLYKRMGFEPIKYLQMVKEFSNK